MLLRVPDTLARLFARSATLWVDGLPRLPRRIHVYRSLRPALSTEVLNYAGVTGPTIAVATRGGW